MLQFTQKKKSKREEEKNIMSTILILTVIFPIGFFDNFVPKDIEFNSLLYNDFNI